LEKVGQEALNQNNNIRVYREAGAVVASFGWLNYWNDGIVEGRLVSRCGAPASYTGKCDAASCANTASIVAAILKGFDILIGLFCLFPWLTGCVHLDCLGVT